MTDATKKPKKPIWKRWWAIALGAVVLIMIISSIANGGKSATQAASSDQSSAASAASDESPAAAPTKTPASEKPAKKAEPAVPAEYQSALNKAQQYSDMMHMSKLGIYDQLTSASGEQFSKAAGKYAVDHVHADWNANALAKAKDYQEQMSMSPAAIHDQLTSSAGEKFTQSQADYAIKHLND